MNELSREKYELEDFVSDETFLNYHSKSNIVDQLSWEKWLLDHPEKQVLVEKAKELINTLSLTITDKEYQEELRKIVSGISRKPPLRSLARISGAHPVIKSFKSRKRALLFLVPTILLIAFAIGYWFFGIAKYNSEKLTETVNNSTQPLILTLSDGTVVSLEAGSSLKYPLYFKEKERIVYLHGNGQFKVKRDINHPFKVHDENIVATVLGTVFNMRSSGDSAVVVELLKGKLNVEVMNSKMEALQSVLLVPNERAVYVRNDHRLYKNLIKIEPSLSFKKSSFYEIAQQIKDSFGITIINESAKKDWRFTGDFQSTTAIDIIENICLVKNLSFETKGDTIIIK